MDVENLAKELILKNMTPEQQMAVLDSVRQSVAQAKEVQKRKIGENVDLVVQALKKIESDIRSRFDDVGNSIENELRLFKMVEMALMARMVEMEKTEKTAEMEQKVIGVNVVKMGVMEWMVLMVFLSPMLVLILMVHLSLLCLQVLSLMLARLFLLTLLNPSKSLLMVAALLSMYLIL
jgi:hypothetical protein